MSWELRPPDGHSPAGYGDGRERLADATPATQKRAYRFATRPGAARYAPAGPARQPRVRTAAGGATRPRLIILNVMLLAVGIAAWQAGYLAAFSLLGWQESVLLALLGAYMAVGLGAAWCGRWDTVRRVANALPAWGLAFTGVGLLLAAAGLHSLTPDALSVVFRSLVFAVAPNIIGVLGFAWLTMLANWAAGQDT